MSPPSEPTNPSWFSVVLSGSVLLTGLVPVVVAMGTIIGLGVVGLLPPWLLSITTLTLVVLPWLGIASLFRRRLNGLAVGAWIWPVLLLAGIPLYLPQERADALVTGMAHLVSPLPEEHNTWIIEKSRFLAALLRTETLAGELPPPEAELEPPAPAPQATTTLPTAGVALPYEGTENQRRVSVVIEDVNGETREVWMIFDTGASLTTVDNKTLNSLGVEIPANGPQLDLKTANGIRRDRVALLERVWVGGMPVEGVTVAACDPCAPDDGVGLLGLNVTGMFHVTLDPERQEIVLQPRNDIPDRLGDISPWVELSGTFHTWSDGRVEMEVGALNQSRRLISRVSVAIDCGEKRFRTDIRNIEPGATESQRVSLPRWTTCTPGIFSLRGAHW